MKQTFHLFFILFLFAIFGARQGIIVGARGISVQCEMKSKETKTTAQGGSGVHEKSLRSPAQKKIDSQLLYAIYRQRGEAKEKGIPPGESRLQFDEKRRVLVSIRARVTKALLAKIKGVGGKVVSSFEQYNDIHAHVPLEKLEVLASLKDVHSIMPAEEATTNSAPQ